MSRKSSFAAFGTGICFQLSPPSVVRKTVPAVPLAQAVLSLTALTPRRRALTPVSWGVHAGAAASINPTAVAMTSGPLDTGPRRCGLGLLVLRERRHQHRPRGIENDRDHQPPDSVEIQRL